MKNLHWLAVMGCLWLFGMTVFATRLAWTRYSAMNEIDGTTTGYVVSSKKTSGRNPNHYVTVGYSIDGRMYTVHGTAEAAGVEDFVENQVEEVPVDNRRVTVYYSRANPSVSSFSATRDTRRSRPSQVG